MGKSLMIIALGKNTENKMKTFAAFISEAGHFAQQVHTVPVKEFPNQNDPNKLKPYGGIPKWAQATTEAERSSGGVQRPGQGHTVDTKYHGIAQHHGLTWKRGGPHSGDYEGRNHTLYADHGAWTVQDHMGKELGKGKTCQSAH